MTETNINTKNNFQSAIFFAVFVVIATILMIFGPLIASEQNSNSFIRSAKAASVQGCPSPEVLSGTNCLTNKNTLPVYELKCPTGLIEAESSCLQVTQKACTDYPKAIAAETGYCKFDPTQTIYGNEILDYDGRRCRINGSIEYFFIRYNVTLASNSTTGPIVCASPFIFSLNTSTSFRFIPQTVTKIDNFISTVTSTNYSACPAGYVTSGTTQCSTPADPTSCNAGGEIGVVSNSVLTCSPCPAGQYCQVALNATNSNTCPNGGSIQTINSSQKCVGSNLKYTYTGYTDGCPAGYLTNDQSCAVKQIRTRDIDVCSYFYASNNNFVTAATESNGLCSTGGRTDFAGTDIFLASNLQCNGPGTAYYNYNVGYDPLVCGNAYDANNKAAFRWSPITYTKITPLQKIPTQLTACPGGWTQVSTTSNDCYEDSLVVTARTGSTCPANSYCPESTTNPTPCPTNYTSPAGSDAVSDCTSNGVPASSNAAVILTGCVSALPGYNIVAGTNTCAPCGLGFFSPGGLAVCKACPIGSYCPALAAAPTICPATKTTAKEGSSALIDCISIALAATVATPRTGGYINTVTIALAIFGLITLVAFYIKLNPRLKLTEWKKVGK